MKKRILIALALALVFTLVACDGGGGSNSKQDKALVGTWVESGTTDGTTFTFNEDGTGVYDPLGTGRQDKFTWEIDDGSLYIDYGGTGLTSGNRDYTVSGDKLTLDDGYESYMFTVAANEFTKTND